MKKVFIINAHQYYPFAEGKLNATMADKAADFFKSKGYEVKTTTMKDDYDVDEEIEKHLWADIIFLQTPINWMSMTWIFKNTWTKSILLVCLESFVMAMDEAQKVRKKIMVQVGS